MDRTGRRALTVIGPERLPGTIRTASIWLGRFRRSFNEIKQEVQQEIHNDAVMQELRKTGNELKSQAEDIKKEIDEAGTALTGAPADDNARDESRDKPTDQGGQ